MSDIITVTLNPAYDLHYTISNFRPYKENIVETVLVESGGKGVNISRALLNNNKDSIAFVILGRENSDKFEKTLQQWGLKYIPMYVPGKIRENITIHPKNDPETRICLDNFYLNDEQLEEFFEKMSDYIQKGTIVAFSGRIPRGITTSNVLSFLHMAKDAGALLAVDSCSFDIEALSILRPWLIKPNEQEIESLCKKTITSLEDALSAAKMLASVGIDNVIVSMGGKGAAYVGCGAAYKATVPHIAPISTIGAGDSTVAGFISGFVDGLTLADCLKRAIAFGTAACLTEGTLPPRPQEVARLIQEVTVTKVD